MNHITLFRKVALGSVFAVGISTHGATFLSFSSGTYSVLESGSNAAVSVLRSGNPHGTMTVTIGTSNGTAKAGTDYGAVNSIVSLRSGQRLKIVSIPIVDNLVANSNKTFTVALSNPSSGGSLRNPKSATVTIIDNDGNTVPNVSINNVSQNEGNAGTTPFVFHVTLSPPSTSTVSVAYATEDGDAIAGTDYTAVSGKLTFNPGETVKIITVGVHADTVDAPDKVFFVNLTSPVNATVAPAQGIGIILNDDGPMVADDFYSTTENTPLNVAAPGVLGNDTNVAGLAMTAELASDVSHGTLVLNADGSFSYTPDANFIGTDTFQYQAFDKTADSQVATVTITVQYVNQAPVAYPDSFGTAPDTALDVSAPGVLANDFDPENDPLGAALVSNPTHGAVTLNADGSLHYEPASSFTGIDSFTYLAFDGEADSAPATVRIYVDATNHVPVANPDNYSTGLNSPLNIAAPGVLANDTDADHNPLRALLYASVAHGSLSLNTNGAFLYTPANGYAGFDHFPYRAADGTATSSVAIVTIAVGSFNNAPVANDDDYTVARNRTLTGNILTNDTDAQNDPLSALLVTEPAHGALRLNAEGSFEYVPDHSFSGTDMFTYRATDGALASNLGVVTITVTPASGADDADLYAKSVSLYVNWATPNSDRFRISGKLNPRGARANVAGARIQVSVNGVPVGPAATFDAKGKAAAGTTKAKFSSTTGAYSFSVTGADLRNASGLTNATESSKAVVTVGLAINGANLDLPVVSGDLEMLVKSTAGKSSAGKFTFKSNRTLTGTFNWNKTAAAQLADGKFQVTGSGVIEAEGGTAVAQTGPARITVGGGTISGGVLTIADLTHTFKFSATEVDTTGLPAASAGAPVTCQLPVMFEIPTATGTNIFETIIELKRTAGTSTKWKR
jgi:VCBS repeat-containing protein